MNLQETVLMQLRDLILRGKRRSASREGKSKDKTRARAPRRHAQGGIRGLARLHWRASRHGLAYCTARA